MSVTRILMIAHPGPNLDSLSAVLPGLLDEVILFHIPVLGNVQAAILEHHPHLVIIDSEIGFQEALSIHGLLTTRFPEIRVIVLSDAAHWQPWKTLSESHQVLLKGFSTRRLKVTLTKALSGSAAIGMPAPTYKV